MEAPGGAVEWAVPHGCVCTYIKSMDGGLQGGAAYCKELESSWTWRHLFSPEHQENQDDPMPGRHNREQKGTGLHSGRACQALATCFPILWKLRLLASLWPCCSPSLPCFCGVAPCVPWKRCSTLSHHQAEKHSPRI